MIFVFETYLKVKNKSQVSKCQMSMGNKVLVKTYTNRKCFPADAKWSYGGGSQAWAAFNTQSKLRKLMTPICQLRITALVLKPSSGLLRALMNTLPSNYHVKSKNI